MLSSPSFINYSPQLPALPSFSSSVRRKSHLCSVVVVLLCCLGPQVVKANGLAAPTRRWRLRRWNRKSTTGLNIHASSSVLVQLRGGGDSSTFGSSPVLPHPTSATDHLEQDTSRRTSSRTTQNSPPYSRQDDDDSLLQLLSSTRPRPPEQQQIRRILGLWCFPLLSCALSLGTFGWTSRCFYACMQWASTPPHTWIPTTEEGVNLQMNIVVRTTTTMAQPAAMGFIR